MPSLKRLPLKPLKPCKLCNSCSETPNRAGNNSAAPRPHQWLLMGVQACRLPALKPLKRLKSSKPLKRLKPSKPFKPLQPVMGVQGCDLPGVKRLPLKPFKPCKLCKSCSEHRTVQAIALPQGHHRLNIPLACFILQPTGTPWPHINGFLWASKPAVCQPLNP